MSLELEAKRAELSEVNNHLFSLLEKRKSISIEIATIKSDLGHKSNWDPAREFALFKSMKANSIVMSMDEAFLFSFTMESQARQHIKTYPNWESSAHLSEKSETVSSLREKINPILLFVFYSEEYNQLKLTENIKQSLKGLLI